MFSGWFRWQFVLPRVLLVLVALLSVQYGLGVVARSRAIRTAEAALGARVEVEHARVSPTGRHVVLSNVRLTNPSGPAEPLLQADHCDFELSRVPLLRHQTIIDRGRITGLRVSKPSFGRNDETGGASTGPPQSGRWFHDDADEVASAWIASIHQRFAMGFVDGLPSVVESEALCARWQEHSAALDRRTRGLKTLAAELQESVDAAQSNQLRHAEFYNELPGEIAALRKQFDDLAAEVETLPESLDVQRRAVIAARRQDEKHLRKRLLLEPTDPDRLSAYLLREQVAAPLNEVSAWLQWARQIVPAESAPHQSSPTILIRNLEMQGVACCDGKPAELRGMLTGLTDAPALHGEPMRLRLRTTGPQPMMLHATIDRTGAVARDELLLDCRGVSLPEFKLGRPDQLEVQLAHSVGSLLVSVRVEGETLSGDIQLVQNDVRITPALGGELGNVPLASPLQATLGQVNSVATRLSLGGTTERPTCALWSNLGPAVAEALEQALRSTGDEHAQVLLAEARRRVDERLAALERQVSDDQARFASQMATLTGQLDTIARQKSQRGRINVEHIGRRLSTNSLR